MAANNQVGSGAVVLTTSADPLVAGLNKAEGDVNKWKKNTQANLNKSGPDILKGAAKGMKLGEVMEMGLTGGIIALGMAVAKTFATGPLDLFNAALERGKQLTEQLTAAVNKNQAEFLKRVDLFGGGGSAVGGEMLRERIASAENSGVGKQNELNAAREALDNLRRERASFKGQAVKMLPFQEAQLEAEMKAAEKRLADAETNYGNHVKNIEELKAKLKEPVKLGTLEQLDVDNFGKAQEQATALQASVDGLNESLRIQAATYGRTGAAAEIAAMKAKGASDSMLMEAEARTKHLKELANIANNNGPKLAGAIEAGSQDAFAASLNAQGFDLGGDNAIQVQKDSQKILEKIAESNERFEKLMEELNGKWEGGGF